MQLRSETPGDEDAIAELTQRAFAPMPYSNGSEGPILDGLRKEGDLTLSLVMEEAGVIIGHVAFSPVMIEETPGQWFGLGPISVAPERQMMGIGRILIEEGLARLKAMGASGCILVGSPALYHRFGFVSHGALKLGPLDPSLIQHIVFEGDAPTGPVRLAPAFMQQMQTAV